MSSSISASWLPAQLSRNEAQAHTVIAQRAWGLALHCGGTDWQASLRPVIQAPWSTAPNDTFISIEWAGSQLQLQLPAATTEQLLSALLGGAALPHIPEEMHLAAQQAALSELLTGLEQLGRGAPQVMASSNQPPAALPHSFAWRLDATEPTIALTSPTAHEPGTTPLMGSEEGPPRTEAAVPLHQRMRGGSGDSRSGGVSLCGLLRADSLGLLLMAGLASGRPLRNGPLANDSTPVSLHLDIGYATVSSLELQQLGLGDVLLMEHSFLGPERVLWLQAPGAGGLHVQLPPQTNADDTTPAAPFLTVVQSWTQAMPALENPLNEAASFDAIAVRLSFDLGEVSLTLAQLRALQPGQTIQLGHPVASAVRIRANGALVGEGELIEIDGQLGVSVSQLFATHE